jgi:hypothetical protein
MRIASAARPALSRRRQTRRRRRTDERSGYEKVHERYAAERHSRTLSDRLRCDEFAAVAVTRSIPSAGGRADVRILRSRGATDDDGEDTATSADAGNDGRKTTRNAAEI